MHINFRSMLRAGAAFSLLASTGSMAAAEFPLKNGDTFRTVGARPVYFTSSPINNGDTMARLGGNTKLHQYAEALKNFSADKHAPFADQFHAVIDVWGKNKPRENLVALLDSR